MTDRTENNRVFDTTKILVIAAMGLTFNYAFILGNAGFVVAYDQPGGNVINVESDTFDNQIFQKVLQN